MPPGLKTSQSIRCESHNTKVPRHPRTAGGVLHLQDVAFARDHFIKYGADDAAKE
jgi:hypothetical protein